MKSRTFLYWVIGVTILFFFRADGASEDALVAGFADPPNSARVRAYWWWLNGNVTKAAITRDLEGMKAKGFGGAVLFDAGGSEQEGNDSAPNGPCFFSPEWRELYKHTLREADRLGLEISLNIQSGWNLGGPMVQPEQASKLATWSQLQMTGPAVFDQVLPRPKQKLNFYRDVAVLAYRLRGTNHAPIQMLSLKTAAGEFAWSTPDCSPLLTDVPAVAGEEDCQSRDVIELTKKMDAQGRLHWRVPAGQWEILRFGYTASGAKVSTCSPGWNGLAIDYLDPDAFRFYWREVVEPLLADAGPLAGRSLKYLHTDSWELGGANWSAHFREEFRRRRGYDPAPFLPVFAGRIVDSRDASNRFLFDLRKTVGECIAENHYKLMGELARQHGIGIHPESGGPHGAPIDSIHNMGLSDVPMSEFWARSWRHRVADSDRFFVKQPASAAHIYGRRIVAAEGFTTIGPHWQETLWDNLKPSFDQAACEGLNRLVWHAFTCSPQEMGWPGQEYFAGTHFNPNSTWWEKSGAFLAYIDRCQFLLQQGLFVADACYYYGDNVPVFAQLKRSDPAKVLPGFDYDVVTEDALLNRMDFRDGRFVLPDGMCYRVLVLPERDAISLPVLRKVEKWVAAGGTVLGPKPSEASGLNGYPRHDAHVRKLARELWGDSRPLKGRVFSGLTARELFSLDGLEADFEASGGTTNSALDFIHRNDGETEIYFVVNKTNQFENLRCIFRVDGKQPELWDPVTGKIRLATDWSAADGRTTVPLQFMPYGSIFVIFRNAATAPKNPRPNFPTLAPKYEITGEWTVKFDPKWGGPEQVVFPQLTDWTQRPELGIRYYSGTATYQKTFDCPDEVRAGTGRLLLDLGMVKNLAEVKLNGKSHGVLWTYPFQVDVTDAIRPTGNILEIEVVNFWPNRVIGDQFLPPDQQLTHTNVRKLTRDTPLVESGLLGPVRLISAN